MPRLIQIAQYAEDLDRASTFYATLLGTDPTARFDPPGLVFFDLGGVRLLLEKGAPSALHYFEVTDLTGEIERLRALGVIVVSEPRAISGMPQRSSVPSDPRNGRRSSGIPKGTWWAWPSSALLRRACRTPRSSIERDTRSLGYDRRARPRDHRSPLGRGDRSAGGGRGPRAATDLGLGQRRFGPARRGVPALECGQNVRKRRPGPSPDSAVAPESRGSRGYSGRGDGGI